MRSIPPRSGGDRALIGALHPATRSSDRSERAHRAAPALLVAVLVVATILRLWGLGSQSLWVDEVQSVSFANDGPVLSEVRERGGPLEPPLTHVLTEAALLLPVGVETAGRLPAALAGVLEVLALFLLVREVFRRRAIALTAAAFLAVAPFAVRYAQEARHYTLFSALHLLSWWLLLRAIRRWRSGDWLLWGVAAGALALTSPFFAFVLPVQVVVVAAVLWRDQERGRQLRQVGGGLVAAAVVALPWYLYGATLWLDERTYDYHLADPFTRRVTVDGSLVRRSADWLLGNSPDATPLVVVLGLLVVVAPFVARPPARSWVLGLIGYLAFLTGAVALVARVSGTYFAFRRVEFFVPLLLALAAVAIVASADRIRIVSAPGAAVAGGAVVAVVLVLSFVASVRSFDTEKTAWNDAFEAIAAAPSDTIVVVGPFPEPWLDRVERYLAWKDGDQEVVYLDDEGNLDLPATGFEGALWLTGAPPSASGFEVRPLNDVDDLEIVAGDRSWGQVIIPLYLSESSFADDETLRRQLDHIRSLPPFLPAP